MKQFRTLLGIIFLLFLYSCVQETHLKTVTIKLDMNAVKTVENVGMKGSFTNPSWEQFIQLIDDNHDGIYEAIINQKTATNRIQFKFINQGNYELKDQPNRILEFEYKPQTLTYEATFNVPEGSIITE